MANVFSVGDLLILLGLAYGLHHLCGSRLVRSSRRAELSAPATTTGAPATTTGAPALRIAVACPTGTPVVHDRLQLALARLRRPLVFLDDSRWNGQIFVGGAWVSGAGGVADVIEPATGAALAQSGCRGPFRRCHRSGQRE